MKPKKIATNKLVILKQEIQSLKPTKFIAFAESYCDM